VKKVFVLLALLLVASAFASAALAQDDDPGGRPLSTTLTGAAERPGPGDPDGSGWAFLALNQGLRRICYEIQVADILLPARAAHIHVGGADVAGPIVVHLNAPNAEGYSSGCASVDRDLIRAIRQNPDDYYVNVHTTDFPAGAVRGQLSK
jgi:hypothetical protein